MSIRELPAGETHLAHAAIVELRPDQSDLAGFVRRFDEVQRPQGCRLYAAFDGEIDRDQAVGAAVFRPVHNLAWGDALYVDDLSVRQSARRRGHATALLTAIEQEATRLGCRAVHLDSGHQRHDAHRVYLANGFRITSHHFARDPTDLA